MPGLASAYSLISSASSGVILVLLAGARGPENRRLSSSTSSNIHLRPENPKFGGVDDAEIVGDRIAEDGPVLRHPLAQEVQHGLAEIVVGRVAPVVGDVLVHQPPQALDRIEMRAVAGNEMKPDPAPRPRQPLLHEPRMMVAGIVEKDVDQAV